MRILANGVAVTGTSHHAEWCETEGLIHDKFTAGVIRDIIRSNNVKFCVDGGANIGSLTRVMLDEGCRVLAFEPNLDAARCLNYNCETATNTVFIINSALGSHAGYTGFTELADNAGASFCTDGTENVRVDILDSWISLPIGFIKLDVEGWELRALRGGEDLIVLYKPIMLIEINRGALARQQHTPEMIYEWLTNHGYSYEPIQPDLTLNDEQLDIICK